MARKCNVLLLKVWNKLLELHCLGEKRYQLSSRDMFASAFSHSQFWQSFNQSVKFRIYPVVQGSRTTAVRFYIEQYRCRVITLPRQQRSRIFFMPNLAWRSLFKSLTTSLTTHFPILFPFFQISVLFRPPKFRRSIVCYKVTFLSLFGFSMFLNKVCSTGPFLLLILEWSLLEKRKQSVPLFCLPFDWWGWNRFWYYLGTKWSFIAKNGTNCSEFRILSGQNWSLMDDLGTVIPKNVFVLKT